jgi:hypothetical protein
MRVVIDDDLMRDILQDVGGMRTALELELWASWILGQAWKQRVRQPLFQEVDWMLTVGSPLVAMISGIGGARARKALSAISMLERGPLGSYAGAVALTLTGARTPAWMTDMASARFADARSMSVLGEGEIVTLDLYRAEKPELTVAIFIDHQLGGIAKHIYLLEPVADEDGDVFCEDMEPADLGAVAARVRTAIARTDREPAASVSPGFADMRAFVLARVIDACDCQATA